MARDEVERLKQLQAADLQQMAESSREKDDQIAALRRELAATKDDLTEARRRNRWSPAHWIVLVRKNVVPWVRARRLRLILAAIVLAAAITLQLVGWGGTILKIVGWVGVIVAIVAADFQRATNNVKRVFGT